MGRSVDSFRFLSRATRRVVEAWIAREREREAPFTPLAQPLADCTLALVSTAAIALRDDRPFDVEGERRNPWWGDPSYRVIPRGASARDVRIYHTHIDPSYAERDINCILPLQRVEELAAAGEIGAVAASHYSFMGYLLRPDELLATSVPAMIERMRADGVDVALLVPV